MTSHPKTSHLSLHALQHLFPMTPYPLTSWTTCPTRHLTEHLLEACRTLPYARQTYWPLWTICSPPTDSHISLGCIMVVFSAKLFGLFYLRVLRQISTSTVTLMANEVSVSFASFSNTVHALRQRGVSQLLHETFISPLFHLKSSSVNLKNYWIYSILC